VRRLQFSLVFVLASAATILHAAPAPRPSSFYGAVTVGGSPVAAGTPVSAWVGDVPFAETGTFEVDGESVFRLDVPGDVLETAAVEGGVDGQEVVFRVGNAVAPATGTWLDGTVARVDLAVGAGPDLAVTKDDGVAVARPGDLLTYTIGVSNAGPGASTGIALEDPLPVGTSFVSASDGGTASGGTVTWPAFDLAEGESVTRTLTLEVASSFPAGTTEIANTATALDDGTHGADADLANNSATDADALAGGPDVVVTKSADLSVGVPGADLVYTITLENRGFQPATGVVLTDTLPAAVTFFTASDDGRAVDGVVTWPPVDVAVGDVLTRTVRVRITATLPPGLTELVNTIEAPVTGDAEPADNRFDHVLPIAQQTDVAVVSVDVSGATTDPQSLAITGQVAVGLTNLGNEDAAGFDVAVFEDLNGDEAYTAGADNLLGTASVALLAPGETTSLPVPVSGSVLFRDNRVFAFADSGQVLAELDEDNNIGQSATGCQAVPPPEDFAPVVELDWPGGRTIEAPGSIDSLSTPLVVNLTDDNGDGRIDERDVPEIVFVTIDLADPFNPQPRLRAIRGDTGASVWDAYPPISGLFQVFTLTGAAAGDIDLDGKPEIIVSTFDYRTATGRPNRIAAYENDGRLKWVSGTYSTHPDGDTLTNRDNPSIADLDGDGVPEIIVGANVFNNNGSLRWTGTGGQGYQSARNDDLYDSGAISVAADLDLDGTLEVVTGNTAYRADGSILWQVPYDDGYPAVANFDADPEPEIVVVSRGYVRLHDSDGTLLWQSELPGAGAEAGGAPTVANFDADPEPEIGVAGSTQYTVFESDGSVKWQAPTQDGSSNMTGSTVFDLDGDGRYEVMYRDETRLRIYRGEDGTVLFSEPMSSVTLNEEVVVADVDRDGNAEIVATTDIANGISVPRHTRGLKVFGDSRDHWVAARPIWNQHQYHIDNVLDDGRIPAHEEPSWLSHNTFRANVAPAAGAFAAPDLSASRMEIDVSRFPEIRATVRIGNGGTVFSGAGTMVAFYDGDPSAGGTLLGTVPVGRELDPGEFADVAFTFQASSFGAAELYARADDDGTGAGSQTECDEANNLHGVAYDTDALGLVLTKDDGSLSLQPGEVVTYTLTVANAAVTARTGVSLTDTLPPNTTLVAASDGGTESGGTVTWPAFDLAGGAVALRTLTLQVDPAIPLTVGTLTNTATVTDDGNAGPDPTPENNTASDTDAVLTVHADAGGPYAGDEGAPIDFDGSGSSDRDGTVVAYAWDLDGDGQFDDATGPTASWSFPDNGTFTIALQVTDDSGEMDVDTAPVVVANLPASFDAGPDQAVDEGETVRLDAVPFTDPGTADIHSATADWGDGTVESLLVNEAAGAGTISGSHLYPDDGAFTATICVADDDGATACDPLAVTVANVAPTVLEPEDVDLHAWTVETLSGGSDWRVAADGLSVRQLQNSNPSVFLSPLPVAGVTLEGQIRVDTSGDDDFIGFVLGFRPGDFQDPQADYLLLDWKQGNQDVARRGLALSRIRGIPTGGELWSHRDSSVNGSAQGIEELQRGFNHGDSGWASYTTYTFRIQTTPDGVRVWVDGVLEIDVEGDFGLEDGALGFYNFSQGGVVYSTFERRGAVLDEGGVAAIEAEFVDPGVEDTHTATIDWQDGAVEPGQVVEDESVVRGEHLYQDDGELAVEVCVTDDDGGTGCGTVDVSVHNRAPVVDAGGDRLALSDAPLSVDAAFTDAGVLDTHTATVRWGDGAQSAATVAETGGAGTASASHSYGSEGDYDVEVCVTDDDGETGCDGFTVTWRIPVLDVGIDKIASRGTVQPGETVLFAVAVENRGSLTPTGVVVTDVLPADFTLLEASGGPVDDPVAGTLTWTLSSLPFGAREVFQVALVADDTAPAGTEAVNVVSVTDDGASGPDANPADNSAEARVVLGDGVTPVVEARSENLARAKGASVTVSTASGRFPAARAVDGQLDTSWFSVCGDSVSSGTTPFFEVTLPAEATVRDLLLYGNRELPDGSDILAGRFELFGSDGRLVLDTGVVSLPAPVRDLALDLPDLPGVTRVRFTPTADEGCSVGIAELDVRGFFGRADMPRAASAGVPLVLGSLFRDTEAMETHSATVDWGDGNVEPAVVDRDGRLGTVSAGHTYGAGGSLVIEVCVTDSAGLTGCDSYPVAVEAPQEGTLVLTGTVRDFHSSHPDFEDGLGDDRGIVETVLGDDRKPVYASATTTRTTHGKEYFDQWYRDVPGVNLGKDLPILLDNRITSDRRVYTYSNGAFFPIDHQLFGNEGRSHNYHFTYEVHSEFLYQGGEVFTFRGDDDVWVFLNRNLAINLGGVHGAETQSVNLDAKAASLGMTPGAVYDFDLFFAERHTVSSSFRIDTSITLEELDPGFVELSRPSYQVAEPDGAAVIGVTRSGGSTGRVEVDVVTGGSGSAIADEDYTPVVTTVVFEDGELGEKTFTVPILDDSVPEPTEDVPILITAVRGNAEVGRDQAPLLIFDDDGTPVLQALKVDRLAFDADGDGAPSAGDVIDYEITLTNTGDSAATGVVFEDVIPEHTTLVPGSVFTSVGTVLSEDPVRVVVGSVGPGVPVTLAFRVRIDPAIPPEVEQIVNQGAVTSAQLPFVPTDDPDLPGPVDPTVTSLVRGAPVLEAEKTDHLIGDAGGDGLASPGDVLEYRLVLRNTGLATATNVMVEDPVPAATSLISGSVTTDHGSVTAESPVRVAVGDLAPGAQATITFQVRIAEPFPVERTTVANQALIRSDQLPELPSDDPDTEAPADPTVTEVYIVPEVSILDASAEESAGEIVFDVVLSEPSNRPVTMSYATVDGTALAGEDYTAAAGAFVIPAGAASGPLAVPVTDDTIDELDETLLVTLSEVQGAVVVDGEAEGTILDDDTAAISIDDVTVEEGDSGTTDAVFTVSLATEADREIRASYVTVEGSATEGEDYLAVAGELAFPAGETEATVAVPVVGDLLLEPDEETFFVDLSDPVEAPIADERGVGTILDDELCPGPNLLANPGAEARPVDGEIPGWTEVEGSDWQWWRGPEPPALEGVASFFAGQPAATDRAELVQDVDLAAYGSRIAAGNQQFAFEGFVRTTDEVPPDVARIVVEYRDAAGLVLDAFDTGEIASPGVWLPVADTRVAPPATATVRVRLLATRFTGEEADAFFDALSFRSLRAPALAIGDVATYEGDSGTHDAVFPVTLSCPYYQEVTTAFATADGTAIEPEDYLATSGVLVFPVGQTFAEVPVPVVGDLIDEPDETFLVQLSAVTPAGEAVLADPVGVGTILNDDWCPRTRGYWKNHVEAWPVDFLVIGGVEYDAAGVLALLDYGGPDPSTRLASHLAATKLNLARGGRERESILPVVEAADAFLEVYPPGSGVKGAERTEANRLKDLLDAYNNGIGGTCGNG